MNKLFYLVLFLSLVSLVSADDTSSANDTKPVQTSIAPAKELPQEFEPLALELYQKKKLFDTKKSFPLLRKAYTFSFEKEHDKQIKYVWGDESEPFVQFLRENPLISEILFTSINPKESGNDIGGKLLLFKTLWERFPAEFEQYPVLAIAVALTWGKARPSIHSSPIGQHQAAEAEGQATALDNFEYYSKSAKFLGEDRIKYMPWEFLSLIVNHTTTAAERKWAIKNYMPKREMIGKIYGKVPYDSAMLKGSPPKLTGQPFTLENQLFYGGVCTCQGDFATRVAKSLAVPAYYTTGSNRFGDNHAWVMWVEIESISATGMRCKIAEAGRYNYDHYYVGNTLYPPLGRTTDHAAAMHLYSLGLNTTAHRHAVLLMRVFEYISAIEAFKPQDRLDYLCKVIDVNPFCTEAWRELAKLVQEGELPLKCAGTLTKYFTTLLQTFAPHPDFTLEIFDDYISFEPWKKKKAENYGKLCSLYETAKRPDLAIKAREKYVQYLVEDNKITEALTGLTKTCMKFPEESNFNVQILKKVDELCKMQPEKTVANYKSLAVFYKTFLPKVPQRRGSEPSEHCKTIYKLALNVFEQTGEKELLNYYSKELANLNEAKPVQKK